MSEEKQETWLNIQQAMSECGVSRRTVYNWIQRGKVTYKKTAGGCTRILQSSLWMQPSDDQTDKTVQG